MMPPYTHTARYLARRALRRWAWWIDIPCARTWRTRNRRHA
jgi:hypothetical protein